MNILTTSDLPYKLGRKTKGLRAKPMVNLIVDRTVMSKFLVDTLEAKEPAHTDAMFCIGENNDAWQQSAKKMLMTYTVDAIDPDGWMVCNPKPSNVVEFCQITNDVLDMVNWGHHGWGYIQGVWGEMVEGQPNMQHFALGDFIVRRRGDTSDVWVVANKIFTNSYDEIVE